MSEERETLTESLKLRWATFWLALASGLVYVRSLQVPFHFDDSHSILNNPGIKSLNHLFDYWVNPIWTSVLPANRVFRPVTFMAYNLAWWVGGGDVWSFHVLKIILHIVLSLLVFFCWRKIFEFRFFEDGGIAADTQRAEKLAAISALVFALHPALSESSIYISSMSSTLCAVFYAAGIFSFLHFQSGSNRRRWLIATLVFYGLSVFSKEEGITLPAVLFMISYLGLKTKSDNDSIFQRAKRALRSISPIEVFAIVLTMATLATIVALQIPASMQESRGHVTPSLYLATQFRGWFYYLKILIWPTGLNADNVSLVWAQSWSALQTLEAISGVIALTVIAWNLRKSLPALGWGLAAAWITLLPTSSFIPLAEPVNERRMILAFFFLIPCLIESLQRTKLLRPSLGIPVLIVFVVMIQNRIEIWNSPIRLWQDVIEKNPENGRAMNNLALQYMSTARYAEADTLLEKCSRVWPTYFVCYINRGIVADRLGHEAQAETSFQEALRLNGGNRDSRFFYADFLERHGKVQEALAEYRRADVAAGGVDVESIKKILKLSELNSNSTSEELKTLKSRLRSLTER